MPDTPRPLPGFATWPTFPFAGDLHVKELEDPVPLEPPRHGDDPAECRACQTPDEAYIWVSERWRVRSLDRPTGLPMVLILESRSHLDLGDLPNMLAAELGVMTVRLERAVRSLDGVSRVHVNRWGDGAAHLHLWFLARPYGRLQLRGTFLSLWDEILPPIPEQQWRENLALVAAWLAEFGGRPLAEPPHIDWKSPATLGSTGSFFAANHDDETGADAQGTQGGAPSSGVAPGGGVATAVAVPDDRPTARASGVNAIVEAPGPGDHDLGDHDPGHDGPGDHGSGDHDAGHDGPGDHGSGDHDAGHDGSGDHDLGDHDPGHDGSGDHDAGHDGPGDHGPGDHDPGDHDPGDHDPDPGDPGSAANAVALPGQRDGVAADRDAAAPAPA